MFLPLSDDVEELQWMRPTRPISPAPVPPASYVRAGNGADGAREALSKIFKRLFVSRWKSNVYMYTLHRVALSLEQPRLGS